MKETAEYFKKRVIEQSKISNNDGYVTSIQENLINGVTLDLFMEDLKSGSGNELISKDDNKPKFQALYSSSALAVNNFSIVKEKINRFSFLGNSRFEKAQFEKQFSTGLQGTPPNLDFAVENETTLIAFESKYLETLDNKLINFVDSYNKTNLSYLDDFWFNVIDKYCGKKSQLDIAQLIKHAIGLIKYKKENRVRKVVLVYIFWTPNNESEFEVYKQHSSELEEFGKLLSEQSDIEFKSLKYSEFWGLYEDEPEFKNHFEKVRERYFINI